MKIRCALLAHVMPVVVVAAPTIYRCPTGMGKFHYHGTDKSQPFRPLVGGHICRHRHQTPSAARDCTVASA